jgi:HD superfamily phosphohydrolase
LGNTRLLVHLPGRVLPISEHIDRLANTRAFRRLRSIKQLALVDILYPGAGYPRDIHCFRTYGYCADMLRSLSDSTMRHFQTPLLTRQAMALSLLHDINHFPFLHAFQEAPAKVMQGVDLIDMFCDGKLTEDSPSIYDLVGEVGLDRRQIRDFLLERHDTLVGLGYEPGLQIIQSMLNSGVDVDKMAYLEDDSRFTGLAYGQGIDVPGLLASATVAKVDCSGKEGWHLAFRETGLSAVESLMMARYWMFTTVYWHPANRAVQSMLLHTISKLYDSPGSARGFVEDTLWMTEEAVLLYLDEKWRQKFGGSDSIVREVLKDRTKVYEMLLSIQDASGGEIEQDICYRVTRLGPEDLERWRLNLCAGLREMLGGNGHQDDQVLLDVPGRRLEKVGNVFISTEAGEVKRIQDMGGPVSQVAPSLGLLAKRLRVFVHPDVMTRTREQRPVNREDLVKLLSDCLPRTASQAV